MTFKIEGKTGYFGDKFYLKRLFDLKVGTFCLVLELGIRFLGSIELKFLCRLSNICFGGFVHLSKPIR